MELNIKNFVDNGYKEYNNNTSWKNYITSYRKEIGKDVAIDIDVLKSIRGGLLYKVRYIAYNAILVDSVIIKNPDIYAIENIGVNILESVRRGKI